MTSLESRLEVQGRLRAASAYLGGQPGWRSRPNLGRACSSTASTSTTRPSSWASTATSGGSTCAGVRRLASRPLHLW